MTVDHVLGILGLGLLFALFAGMHLWRGDQETTSCGGDGKCGNCHGGGCDNEDSGELGV
jgi:hypothetical protein